MHQLVRRADDVHRRAGPAGLHRLRTGQSAHRDYGRRRVPGRGDAQGDLTHAYARGLDLLWNDRNVTGFHADARRRLGGSTGRHGRSVGPHLEIKVVDPATGETVPRGVVGEFCTRGYSVMAGYWNDPQKTAEVIDADGWMHTGDLAEMDPSGYVRIAGRIKDLVVRGGENISPRRSRNSSTRIPILSTVTSSVPDAKYGEELMAVVKLRNDAPELTIERLREYCMGRIARFKIPRYLWIVDEFPMTVTGKVRKVEMRQQALEYLRGQQ